MRGVKRIEYRSKVTNVRGEILIYASLGRYSEEDEDGMMSQYGMADMRCDDLPRGVIIGAAELYDCEGEEWYLRNPKRATKLLKPTNRANPVWFYPF